MRGSCWKQHRYMGKSKRKEQFQSLYFSLLEVNVHTQKLVSNNAVKSGSLSPRHGESSSCGWRNGLQYGGQLRIYWTSSRGQPTMGGPPAWGLGEVLTTSHRKSHYVTISSHKKPQTWTDTLVRHKQWKRDMRFGTCSVRSLYRAGSLTATARELERYKLDLVVVQEFRWDEEGMIRAGDYNFFLWKRKLKTSIRNRIFCTPQNSISS